MRAALPACGPTGPALADTPLTASAFAAPVGTDAVTCARSARNTADHGADHGPDATLRRAVQRQPRFDGVWFGRTDEICLAQPAGGVSACRHFRLDGDWLRAGATDPASRHAGPLDIRKTARRSDPLNCPAPAAGA